MIFPLGSIGGVGKQLYPFRILSKHSFSPLFGLFLEYLDLDVPGFSSSDEWILPLAMLDLHFLGLNVDFHEPPCLARVILRVALKNEYI